VLVSLWCERGEPGVVEKVAVLLSDLFVFNIAIILLCVHLHVSIAIMY
jgi:hypothetical protein